ncbi:MAG: protein-disulfide reductase [Burkholderiales bacterium RIFCSPHIGHO2_12_FULL_61_11]|nr:MAG: protein-disulfide reductase [Burkholderiales bacterium RIFCSPHIGHO2_12_FULL_61_11]
MNFKRFFYAIILIASCTLSTGALAQNDVANKAVIGPVFSTGQVRAELLAWAPEGVEAGKPVWLGLQLTQQPEWHTYWKNPGDSGLPTRLDWTLPAGVTAGDIAWPTPRKIRVGTLANYGYEGTMLLPVPLTVAPGFNAAQLDIALKATWLVCKEICIPQDAEFALKLPVKGSTAMNGNAFAAAFAASPKPLAGQGSQIEVDAKAVKVSLAGLPAALQGKTLDFFPETGSLIEPAAPWQQAWQGAVWTAQLPLSGQRSESPRMLPLVVALDQAAYRIEVPVRGEWPAVADQTTLPLVAAVGVNAALGAAPTGRSTAPLTLIAALLGALLGGLILNLMPCVFPVLALKVVGFVHVKDQATRLTHGLAYSAGVVLSFLALGALLLGLRAAGEQLGWGFQLQSPAVVAALAALFTLIGLNLAGLFEFGNFLPSRLAALHTANPTTNAFLSGVLVTAIASPCTAPFMGAALGYAVGLPATQALAVFAMLGIGMALPYLAASAVPAVARALPRPGAWMVTFKQLMAFPMFATVVWLVWVLGQQSGIDGAGALLALLVLMALAIWTFGLRSATPRTQTVHTVLAAFSIALFALALWAIGPNITKEMSRPASGASAAAASDKWQTWAPGRVEQLTTQGRNVFLEFTAAWCVTCQYNEKSTLSDTSVLADLAAKNVVMLRADWTRRDPAVTAALTQLGRSGVPVYVIYKPGRAPVLLSEILSVDDVRAELAKL